MSKILTTELAKQLISEAPSWEQGHSTSFLFREWELSFCKAGDNSYELTKKIAYPDVTVKYQYSTPEDALIHMANRFSEKTRRFTSIEDVLRSGLRCNTQINYIWRDEQYGEIQGYHYITNGQFTIQQWSELMDATEDGAFIPEEVGLEPYNAYNGYVWHEIRSFQNTTEAPADGAKTPEELIAAFRKVREGWRENISGYIPKDERPYVMEITETLFHSVLVWAKDKDTACEKADDLCNNGTIHLDDSNSIDCTCICSGIATPKDVEELELYGSQA